ncbi:MAG: PAS domain S-box protein [Acidobacteria bacterium]|nr:PAS domain S-box protein [Acidobacteriota bacterium]
MRADDHYRDLVENSSDLIGTHDLEGTILSANAAVVRFVGCKSPEDLVGRKVSDFLGANVRHLFDSYLETLRRDGRAQGIVKARVEAGERILQYNNSLRDGGGVRPVVRCFGRDVTEQKRVEARLRQAQKMEALGRFASGIIHDFNGVLTAISGYCQMALKSITPDSPLYVPLEEIKKAEERATELTRQLLAFGRRQEIQFDPLDLNSVVGGMEKPIRHLLGTQIELVASLHPDIGRINAHRGQLEQVITNLVSNAVHAMPQGGRLTLETHNVRLEQVREFDNEEVPAGSYVVLSVSDTGAGMSYEVRTRIFEPFFTTRPRGKGTGLGLSIVYGIVRQSGGYIGVESQPGRGATFRIFLPRV